MFIFHALSIRSSGTSSSEVVRKLSAIFVVVVVVVEKRCCFGHVQCPGLASNVLSATFWLGVPTTDA